MDMYVNAMARQAEDASQARAIQRSSRSLGEGLAQHWSSASSFGATRFPRRFDIGGHQDDGRCDTACAQQVEKFHAAERLPGIWTIQLFAQSKQALPVLFQKNRPPKSVTAAIIAAGFAEQHAGRVRARHRHRRRSRLSLDRVLPSRLRTHILRRHTGRAFDTNRRREAHLGISYVVSIRSACIETPRPGDHSRRLYGCGHTVGLRFAALLVMVFYIDPIRAARRAMRSKPWAAKASGSASVKAQPAWASAAP